MSTNDQHLDENDAKSTLNDERDEEDTSENLDNFFKVDENDDEEAPVSREEYNKLLKGTQKLATELGRIKSQKPVEKIETKEDVKNAQSVHPVLLNMYFKQNPEVQEVWDEVKKEADKLGRDPFELYENSSYFKGEAKSRFETKAEREANKQKINPPKSGTNSSAKFDVSKTKAEDVSSLTPSQKMEWIRYQASKEED